MVERQLLASSARLYLYARFVDNIFILTTCREEAERIFSLINNVNTHINFTIEHPQNDKKISLLDFTVTTNQSAPPTFEFYKKSARKPVFVHRESAIPTQAKQNIITNEIFRISDRCTTRESEQKHKDNFATLLRAHGYNRNEINDCMQLSRRRRKEKVINKDANIFYLQLPYISDSFDNRVKRIFKQQNIDIRIAHQSFTLRNFLKKNNSSQPSCTLNNCPVGDPRKCYRHHVVYQLNCNVCHQIYIGSTIRSLHTRVREHFTHNTSSVYKHLSSCQHNQPHFMMSTTIIGHHKDDINLRFLEHILIKQHSPTLNSQTDFNFLDPLLL